MADEKYSVTYDMNAIKVWSEAFSAKAGATTQRYINLALKNSSGIVQRREYKEAPRGVTGGTIKSIKSLVTEVAAIIGPDHNLKYPIYIEKGTKPHMPPIDAIKPWAESKGLNPWAVAMGIKKKGTKANPFVKRTFEGTKTEVRVEFALATKMIVAELARARKVF